MPPYENGTSPPDTNLQDLYPLQKSIPKPEHPAAPLRTGVFWFGGFLQPPKQLLAVKGRRPY
jgi:hypothetical protein